MPVDFLFSHQVSRIAFISTRVVFADESQPDVDNTLVEGTYCTTQEKIIS